MLHMIIKRVPERKEKHCSCSSYLAVPIHFHSNLPYSRADCYLSEPGLSKPATSSLFNVIKGRNRPVLKKKDKSEQEP